MRQSVGIHSGILKEVQPAFMAYSDTVSSYPYTAEDENVASLEL
jgi:hypothetical protein